MKVHFQNQLKKEQLGWLKETLNADIQLSSGEILPEHQTTTVLVGGRPEKQDLERFPDLEYVIIPWTGIPEETSKILKDFPNLKIHNLHHNADSTAEMALSLLLSAAKQIIPFDRDLRKGDWTPRYENRDSILLAGKSALVLGFGEIGKRIQAGLEGLGVKVRAIKRTIEDINESDFTYPPKSLHDLLPSTDFLIIALPLTEETDGLIGETELKLLPESAILVNISRGRIVDQEAFYNAIKNREIFAAGLDVWYNYPPDESARTSTLPGDFPFHELENLVLSPHRAGHVREIESLRYSALAELLNAIAAGKEVPNQVDLDLGY